MQRRKDTRRKRPAAKNGEATRRKYSLANPPTGFTMSVEDLAELLESGRNQAYEAVRQGVYPSIRVGNGAFKILVVPTLAILRGEIPPGPAKAPPARDKRARDEERRPAAPA